MLATKFSNIKHKANISRQNFNGLGTGGELDGHSIKVGPWK